MNTLTILKSSAAVFLSTIMLAGCATTQNAKTTAYYPAVDVAAQGETAPVGTNNADAADDPAIWRNAANPADSFILGTDKKAGLYVYDLDGTVRDFTPAGALNNTDLREVKLANGSARIIVGASDRTDRAIPKIALFDLNDTTGKLTVLGSTPFLKAGHAPVEAYGFCMGNPLATGELARIYVVLKDGEVAESRLIEQDGKFVPQYVRSVKFGTQSEGCVVDDVTKTLYVAEEDVGIWKVPLDRETLGAEAYAKVGATDGLVDDVEGLAIARQADGRAWLVVSSQGDNAYVLFDLTTNTLAHRFRINGGAIGGTSETDGIEAILGDFGPQYPEGLFIAQDGDNGTKAQNFKMVSWGAIRTALGIK